MGFEQLKPLIVMSYDALVIFHQHGFIGLLVLGLSAGCLFGMTPLKDHPTTTFFQYIAIWIRKGILAGSVALLMAFVFQILLYGAVYNTSFSTAILQNNEFIQALLTEHWLYMTVVPMLAFGCRFTVMRYIGPPLSEWRRSHRQNISTDALNDIRDEINHYQAKIFTPSEHYTEQGLVIGVDEHNQPDMIPMSTWYEVNMQIIGPSRYGKGVILGVLMDQIIRRHDALVYIDPKHDHWAPQIMFQACQAVGRPFYYVTLHDNGFGQWSPFTGGSVRDAFARIKLAFGLELTGNPGTDFYKSQETMHLQKAFSTTRKIPGLLHYFDALSASATSSKDPSQKHEVNDCKRVMAELHQWSAIQSLCPKKGGFSVEKALRENAVVYIQGDLNDTIVKQATKLMIMEYVQEARRLVDTRSHHLTMIIDEVSFLASQTLAQSLATAVQSRVNFVLAYQSQDDLLNVDDATVNPNYLYQSINVNSQVKAIYGGADFKSAELASLLSGTVQKSTSKLEKTSVEGNLGGETWQDERSIGQQEEPLIHMNTIFTLPPRVFVLFKPGSLAKIRYSWPVTVQDEMALSTYVAVKRERKSTAVLQKKAAKPVERIN